MRKLLVKAYVVVLGAFILLLLARDWNEFVAALQHANLALLLLAIFTNLLALLIQSQAWGMIQRATSPIISGEHSHFLSSFKKSFYTWTKLFLVGYLGRYVPGKISLIVGRLMALAPFGYKRGSVIYAAVFENVSFLLAAIVVGTTIGVVSGVPFIERVKTSSGFISALVVTLPLLVTAFVISAWAEKSFTWLLQRVLNRKAGGDFSIIRLSSSIKLRALILSSVVNILLGVSFAFTLMAIGGITLNIPLFLAAVAAFPLAVCVGVLALFAPSGIGVREGMIVFLLASVVTPQAALLAALIMRVGMCLTELSLYFFASYMSRYETSIFLAEQTVLIKS